ncbi:haloacid dehalogenase type II [Fodinicurvata fenggangensis]|uniref:haloacid dehalogenase type II n=1 Tax=Fodinicurvata fenggangensis TaxID=1121830 RepID=UPI000553F15D|nr:haloacid dehalogenase type II [Fodinicurvata fenggangensis]
MTVCLFDAYGTLLDVHSAVARHADLLEPEAGAISSLWRSKQLEYSWVHALMGHHRDFWTLTQRALDHALMVYGVRDEMIRDELLQAYLNLEPYPDAVTCLQELKERGIRTAILSNGAPEMLEPAVRTAGLSDLLDAVLSIEEIGIYKPDPRVYQMGCDHFSVSPGSVVFLSSNPWDAAGAASFGFRATWVNRGGIPQEYPDSPPLDELEDLDAVAELID